METDSLPVSSRLPGPPKPAKKEKSARKDVSLRFEVELNHSKDFCNHISFVDLVRRKSSSKKKAKNETAADPSADPLDPFGGGDDDEVARIAAEFEAKYGRGSAYEEFIDKGDGYDENDSFIDNAEAYDELIPVGLDPEHGGFYINTGELIFKPKEVELSTNGKEDEFEKASLLQKLKRKRNRIEDDSDSNEPLKVPRKNKMPKEPKEKKNKCIEVSIMDGAKMSKSSVPKSVHEAVVQQIPVKKQYKRQNSAVAGSVESMLEQQQQQQMVPPTKAPRKNAKCDPSAPATVTSTLYGNKLPESMMRLDSATAAAVAANAAATNVASMTQSLIAQMISESLGASGSTAAAAAAAANGLPANNSAFILLKQNLLNSKVPYEVINMVPSSKPAVSSDGRLSSEWNRFLIDIYRKTSALPTKSRNRIFDYLGGYIGAPKESLIAYTSNLATIEATTELRKYSNNVKVTAPSPTHVSSSSMQQLSLLGSSPYGSSPTSLVMPKKNSPSCVHAAAAAVAASSGAINLSTNQASSYGEGLAGKLMSPAETSSASGVSTCASRKNSHMSGKVKPEVSAAVAGLNLSSTQSSLTNFNLLQTLASMASTSSPLSLAPGRASSHLSVSGSTSLLGNSRAGTPPSASRHTSSVVSSIIASSAASSTNPNSLLLSSASSKSAIPATSSSSASTVSPQRNEQMLSHLYSSLPQLFSDPDLINRFLQGTPAQPRPSSGGGQSRQSSTSSSSSGYNHKVSTPTTSISSMSSSLLQAAHSGHRSPSLTSSSIAVSSAMPSFISPSSAGLPSRSLSSSVGGGGPSSALMSSILSNVHHPNGLGNPKPPK